MKQLRINTRVSAKEILAGLAVFLSRFNFLPANISPLGASGFFGNPIIYALSIITFDLAYKGLYAGFWLTYLGFAMYPLVGFLTRQNERHQLLALPIASFLFFLISNFGVWLYWYDHTWQALLLCYTLAVPFYARTLFGDLLFGYGYLAYRAIVTQTLSPRLIARSAPELTALQ